MTDDANLIELTDGARTLAIGARTMFNELLNQGFTATESLKLVAAWIHGLSGGSQ